MDSNVIQRLIEKYPNGSLVAEIVIMLLAGLGLVIWGSAWVSEL